MGVGPFNFERPFTAGDDGVFGVERPLVGAANGVELTLDADSVKNFALQNTTPQAIMNAKEELEYVEEEIRNKKEQLKELNQSPAYSVLEKVKDPITGREEVINIRENLAEELQRLIDTKDNLQRQLDDLEAEPGMGIEPDEAGDITEQILRSELAGLGISKGPYVDYKGDTYEMTVTMVNMDDADVQELVRRVENVGLQVTNKNFFQT